MNPGKIHLPRMAIRGMPPGGGAIAAAAIAFALASLPSCATPGVLANRPNGPRDVKVTRAVSGLDPDRYSGLAASLDGGLFLAEQSGWRAQAFRPGEGRPFEIALPSARCLVAGGFIQGFCAVDLVNREFIRFDQHGSEAYRAGLGGHGAAAFCLAASGETFFLDADAVAVVVRDQGFRESRRWQLRGAGRPQAIAADLLEGLVAVAYPGEGRLDTYSTLGVLMDSSPFSAAPGPQSLAFDGRGRLWAAGPGERAAVFRFSGRRWAESGSVEITGLRALAAGPGGTVLALGREQVLNLSVE